MKIDGGGVGGYEREVHLVRDANGGLLRLEVSETFTSGVEAGGGLDVIGTGLTGHAGTTQTIESVKVFDMTDPAVANSFGATGDLDGAYRWSTEHSDLGWSHRVDSFGHDQQLESIAALVR